MSTSLTANRCSFFYVISNDLHRRSMLARVSRTWPLMCEELLRGMAKEGTPEKFLGR